MLNRKKLIFLNEKNKMTLKFLQIFIIGFIGQWLPHPPNFSPLNSIGIFSGYHSKCRLLFFLYPLFFAFMKDLIFGFHSTMLFVYLSLFVAGLLGSYINTLSLLSTLKFSSFSTFTFYLITNFGVWLTSSLYPLNLKGILLCYLAAIPFLINQILGDVFYGFLFYGIYTYKPISKEQAVILYS